MSRFAAVLLAIGLAGCAADHYVAPDDGTATIRSYPPDALLSGGVMELLIYPDGCPIRDDDQPLLVGRVYGREGGKPISFEVVADRLVVLQVHFQKGNISCRAHMEVALEPGRRYDLRTDLKRLQRNWNDPLDEYLCSFRILGVQSTGMVKPGGTGKPEC